MTNTVSNGDVGVARSIIFQEIRPGSGLKNGDFVEEKLEGAIVERLSSPKTKPYNPHPPGH